jgi:hypothetical protein
MSERKVTLAAELWRRLDEYVALEEIDLKRSPAYIEYRHTTSDEEDLAPSIAGAVTAVAGALGALDRPPARTDVVVRSPDEGEAPLEYHVTREEAGRAATLSPDDSDAEVWGFLTDVVSDAENFVNLEEL